MKPPRVLLEIPKTASTESLLPPHPGMQSWRNRNGFVVLTVPYHADPLKDSWDWFNMAKMGLRDDQFQQEVMIDFTARGGQKVFPYLEAHKNKFLVKPWAEIPKNYTVVCGLDFGSRNPTAILFCAVNERGHFHVFSEFYKPSNPSEIARYLKAHPYFKRIHKIAADPSTYNKNQHQFNDKWEVITSIADMLQDLGIHQLERANNDRLAGIERVKHMFRHSDADPKLQPYLTVSSDCPNLWKELTTIVYKDENPQQLVNRNSSEDTVKKGDHAYDALKYVLLSWGVPSELAEKPPTPPGSLQELLDELDEQDNEIDLDGMLI